jgi:hypothetical protein
MAINVGLRNPVTSLTVLWPILPVSPGRHGRRSVEGWLLRREVALPGQIGGESSLLGEVWYAEAKQPTGPFATARRC